MTVSENISPAQGPDGESITVIVIQEQFFFPSSWWILTRGDLSLLVCQDHQFVENEGQHTSLFLLSQYATLLDYLSPTFSHLSTVRHL